MTSKTHTRLSLADLIDKELMGIEPDSQSVVLDDADWRLITTALRRVLPDVLELVRYDSNLWYSHDWEAKITMMKSVDGEWCEYSQAAAIIAAKKSELTWRNMDSAPMDGTIINALARYEDASAGFPRYIGYSRERGVWLEYSRHEPSVVIPWAWRPRSNWPEEWEIK